MPSGNALGDFASPRTPRSIMEETLLFPTMYAVFKEHAKFYKLKINARLDPIRPFPTDRYYFRKAGMKKDQSAEDATFIRMSDMIILFSFITFICSFSKGIVAEKDTRLREIMRMMGLPDIVYWINCMLVGTIRGGLIAVILMICLCDFGVAQVFVYSDASVIVLFFIVFTMAIVNFSLLFTVPFSSPKIMVFVVFIVQVGTVAMIVTYVDDPAGGLTGYMSLTVPFKLATSLVPQIGIHWLMKLASFSEQKGEGLQWHNINQAVIPGDNIAPIEIIYAMLLSWLLYLLLAMYLDAINPWQYGNANHPLFFLLPSYWCPTVADFSHKASVQNSNKEMIENISKKLRVVVRLVQISHRFGPIRALSNLSVDLYCNQITMLLGHNGAGKTTLMSILTGLIQPDHGEVFINGYSVRKHTRKARESLGFCPQHNVLFDKLTVMEHLVFFGKLKDAEENYLRQEIKHLLSELDLTQKSNSFSKDLSGGMKRKLCLANAMVGGSEIVILDEPTAGMDPEARRAVWGLLQDERRYRTILMTTHYMEEADVLGDRIVFVAKGRLLAAGSPMFLKKKFETGYNLRLSKKSLDVNTARVVAVIKRCLPGNDIVNLDSDIGYEFVVNIGFPSPQQLVELFRYLEDNLSTLGIHSIGISITTMEDVFHKVGEYGEAKSKDGIFSRDSEKFDFTFTEEFKRPFFIPEGHHLSRLRLKALLKKRWLVGRREWRTLFYLGIVPALATMFYCSSTGTNLTDNLQKPITYSLSQIARNPIAFVTKKQDGVVRNFVKALKSEQVEIKTLNPGQDIGKYLLGIASSEPANYKSRWVAGGEYDGRNRVLWYNGEPYHVGGAALATWQGAMLAEATRDPTAIVNVTGLPPASGTMLFGPEDPDVVGERFQVEQAIDTNSTREYAMVVHELTKYYGTFLAVNKISFLVNKKECFGLLGVNGAGKTTTFSMLSGDLSVSSGTAYIRDQQLHNNVQGFQKLIGYCPQQNVLIDSMTGNEMLRLFCALRGVDTDQTDAIIELIVRLTDLSSHADKLTYNYSGGTKRKLCVGLAIVGNPPLLFLDEPTAGIDPTARRKIWGTLTALQREIGSSCMLTSHSMEECEALCQRIAIMVAGSIRCIGSSPDLKLKFSHGFTVLVKLAVDSPQQEKAVIHFMQSVFPSGCRLKQSYQRLLTFHVSKATLRWSVVFERIMTMRNDPALEIEDVQVSDTSLEEIFLSFANRGTFTVNADMSTRSESSSEKLEPSDASETQPAIERDQEDLSDSNSDTVEIIGGRSISKRKRMPLWVLERLPDHHGDGDPDPDSPHIHPVVPRSSMPTNVPPVPRKILADQADLKPHRLEAGKTRKTPSSPTAADVGGNENAEVLRTSRRHPISEVRRKYDVLPKEGITKNARNLASSQSESTDGKNQLQHPIKLFAAHKNDIVKPFSASKRPSKESLDKGKQPLTLAYSLATTNSDQTRTSPTSTPSSDTVESKRIHSIALPDSYQ
ncbi:ATP-binding cassette sub-family A member 3-like [Varroa jacobsoni]|uniref:ATP-binding cassette sub-family A member 3-like n=1 Tax=Varroa jacobsoni TaxID=62625 RepID=UPI000BF59983|nr:ATP-binding cassette sub-family A member 3-like [Varroa jacobsoni]